MSTQKRAAFYAMIWRWHFYAGLFVVPMVLILATTGAAYLFKPQVERWEERAFRALPTAGSVAPDEQVAAALAAFPGARFVSYRLPQAAGDAALVHLGLPGPDAPMRDVFVSPRGDVVGALDPGWRLMEIVHDIHGQLLLGHRGSWIVELAASWAIVMIVTGLFLWWPRGNGLAGVVWPRLGRGRRMLWRDLHAVTGFWVSGLALVLLLTGLFWTDVWGSGFAALRAGMGWTKGAQDWTLGGRANGERASDERASGDRASEADLHAGHDHAAMMAGMAMAPAARPPGIKAMAPAARPPGIKLGAIVAGAQAAHLAFPVIVTPPGGTGRFGGAGAADWTVRSDSQNRPLRTTISYDTQGRETGRESFAGQHVIDRVVGYGIAWHEGALFGLLNQLIGLATALMLVTLSVTGFIMWRRRKPAGLLGAPPMTPVPTRIGGVAVIVLGLALLLPMMALSLVAMLVIERLVLVRFASARRWFGLGPGGGLGSANARADQ